MSVCVCFSCKSDKQKNEKIHPLLVKLWVCWGIPDRNRNCKGDFGAPSNQRVVGAAKAAPRFLKSVWRVAETYQTAIEVMKSDFGMIWCFKPPEDCPPQQQPRFLKSAWRVCRGRDNSGPRINIMLWCEKRSDIVPLCLFVCLFVSSRTPHNSFTRRPNRSPQPCYISLVMLHLLSICLLLLQDGVLDDEYPKANNN